MAVSPGHLTMSQGPCGCSVRCPRQEQEEIPTPGHLRRRLGLLLASPDCRGLLPPDPGLRPAVTVPELTTARCRQGHTQRWQSAGGPGRVGSKPGRAPHGRLQDRVHTSSLVFFPQDIFLGPSQNSRGLENGVFVRYFCKVRCAVFLFFPDSFFSSPLLWLQP